MTRRPRKNYSASYKLEAAQLVTEASQAMNVSKSVMTNWVQQLKSELSGVMPTASPITPEQIEIRELKKKLARLEEHNEILKKATALLMSDSLNNSH